MNEKLGIEKGYLLVDLVSFYTNLSEERFKELDIMFIDHKGRELKLKELDRAFAEFISRANPSRSLLSVYVSEEYADKCYHLIPQLIKEWN